MPNFEQGDVIRVPFPYTDRATRQHRQPAVSFHPAGIGENDALLWVAMVDECRRPAPAGDIPFGDGYADAGFPAPSVIRPCKLADIEARHAQRLGRVAPSSLARSATG